MPSLTHNKEKTTLDKQPSKTPNDKQTSRQNVENPVLQEPTKTNVNALT
jgi:hypothetical protein